MAQIHLTMKARGRLSGIVRATFIVCVCAIVIFPIYWMIVTAIQPLSVTLKFPPPLFPTQFDASGFIGVVRDVPILGWLGNSTVIASLTTILSTTLAVLGAFALSWMRWGGKAVFGFALLLTQLMPEAVIVVPLFGMYNRLGLLQNLVTVALLDAAFTIPICVWILKSAFDRIPREMLEAAYVDGCGHLGVLRRVVIPVSIPAIVAVAVVAFFTAWSEYLFAVTMISRATLYPASVGLASLISQLDTPVAELLSGGLLYALLPVVLYVVVQRYIIAGMTAGAVKG